MGTKPPVLTDCMTLWISYCLWFVGLNAAGGHIASLLQHSGLSFFNFYFLYYYFEGLTPF